MVAGISLILFFQTQEWASPFMKFASALGSLEFFLLFMPFPYWCWDSRLGFRVGLMLALGQGLNNALKIALHGPRPYWVDPGVRALSIEPSFGMPSGHAQYAVCIWGMIARFFRRPWAYALAFGLSLLVGISRVYLGVHFPADVIVGWALGALLLGASLIGEPFVARWLGSLDLKGQVFASFLASLGIIALLVMGWVAMGSWQTPSAWEANALQATNKPMDPLKPQEVNAAGLLFGIAAGYALLLGRGNFIANGSASRRLMRYLLGMAGVLLIWYGIGAFIQVLPAGYAMAYIRSMLAGSWVTVGAPLLFVKLKLAEIRGGPG